MAKYAKIPIAFAKTTLEMQVRHQNLNNQTIFSSIFETENSENSV